MSSNSSSSSPIPNKTCSASSADITEISAEEAKRVLAGLGLDDGEMDDIDLDNVVEYVNEWLKEDVA